jgi:hypothetical protein
MAISLIYRPFIAIAMSNEVDDGARFLEEIADREGVRLVLHQYNEMPLITPNLRNSSSRATLHLLYYPRFLSIALAGYMRGMLGGAPWTDLPWTK